MNKLPIRSTDRQAIQRAIRYAREWSREHQWEFGVAEMALGASILAVAVHNGAIDVGRELLITATSKFGLGSKIGAGLGGTAGAVIGGLVGSIGIAASGTAVGIPAAIVVGGGAIIFAAMGYTIGDIVEKYLNPAPTLSEIIGAAAALTIGVALLVDGARRVVTDPKVRVRLPFLHAGAIYLHRLKVPVVARSREELETLKHVAFAGGISAVGASLAASGLGGLGGVTIAGSQTLGAAAVSLGVVSAPLWPLALGAGVGIAVGWVAWSAFRRVVPAAKPEAVS